MYERPHERPLSRRHFFLRAAKHTVLGMTIVAAALALGVLLYRFAAHLPWPDAFLNAAMILGGMGPVDRLESTTAKLLAGSYALFSGLVFVAVAGIMVAPWFHRLLHKFHFDQE